jgi:hypothetical protein
MVYPALLPLMSTLRLPAVDLTNTPSDLNRLVRFAERRNVISARLQSHFKRSLQRDFGNHWAVAADSAKNNLSVTSRELSFDTAVLLHLSTTA